MGFMTVLISQKSKSKNSPSHAWERKRIRYTQSYYSKFTKAYEHYHISSQTSSMCPAVSKHWNCSANRTRANMMKFSPYSIYLTTDILLQTTQHQKSQHTTTGSNSIIYLSRLSQTDISDWGKDTTTTTTTTNTTTTVTNTTSTYCILPN